jgi:glycosyltransferase involved in cell wall biosynthesis
MRIGIDAHAAEQEGSGNCTYIRNLLLGLSRIDDRNEYVLYVTDPGHPFYKNFQNSRNFRLKNLYFRNPFLRIPLVLAARTWLDRVDILHVQYNSPPAFKGRLVVTIHDVIFLRHPEFFSRWEAFRLKTLTPLTVKKAAAVLTGSQHALEDIGRAYAGEAEKVELILHGVARRFVPQAWDETSQKILNGYQVKLPYILFVGRLNPRKNLPVLFKAFAACKQRELPHRLVIVGKRDFAADDLQREYHAAAFKDEILFTGFVPDEELPHLYSQADMFVYPSFYEGVGLPLLEAMSCGAPVVTSDSTSLKELVGDAGVLIDTDKVEDLARAMLDLARDPELRERLRRKGLARVDAFSWDETARKTLEVYNRVFQEL